VAEFDEERGAVGPFVAGLHGSQRSTNEESFIVWASLTGVEHWRLRYRHLIGIHH
jgi:hypothetical protein